jgi:hypothetical protein
VILNPKYVSLCVCYVCGLLLLQNKILSKPFGCRQKTKFIQFPLSNNFSHYTCCKSSTQWKTAVHPVCLISFLSTSSVGIAGSRTINEPKSTTRFQITHITRIAVRGSTDYKSREICYKFPIWANF